MQTKQNIPHLSIGLPVYNAENYITEAINSILTQTFEDFELIISDNASTDKTNDICMEYAAKDQRIRYYRQVKNIGAALNYNYVVKLARGKYFKWANHDDLCAPKYFERCVKVLDQNPSVILAYPRSILIDEQGHHKVALLDGLGIDSPKPHKRIKRYRDLRNKKELGSPKLWVSLYMPIYGVIRKSSLMETALVGSYISSDVILLDELALQGEFFEVPEYLFFKRRHSQKGTKVNRAYDERILWFNPMVKIRRLLFPKWRLFFERFIAINHVKISWYEKIFCYTEAIQYFFMDWKILLKELIINVARFLDVQSVSFLGFTKELPKVW